MYDIDIWKWHHLSRHSRKYTLKNNFQLCGLAHERYNPVFDCVKKIIVIITIFITIIIIMKPLAILTIFITTRSLSLSL